METFYTYLWLREDGTPYYVGKGCKNRAFVKSSHRIGPPSNPDLILVQKFPDEGAAFAAEIFLISFYGRADLKTGCLRNMTDGGENPPKGSHRGYKHSAETRLRWSISRKGQPGWHTGHKHSAETRKRIGDLQRGKKRKPHSIEAKMKMSLAAKRRIAERGRDKREHGPDGRWIKVA
jgi:hypothetical protein